MPLERPRPWKMALLTWSCVYPLINILFALLMPLIAPWHPLLRTLLLSLLLVPILGALLALLQRRYASWLHR